MKYLRLIRIQNLFLIALVQVLIKYGLFEPLKAATTLDTLNFALLVIATLCIAAGGNIINDIYDVEIDRINKPDKMLVGKSISANQASNLFVALNVIGVGIGFYLSNTIGKPGLSALFIIISALLYIYASYLKSILLVGNLLVSALVAMSLIIVGLFDLMPAITPENQAVQSAIFGIVLRYSLVALFVNFIREIVKDIMDINGDKKGGINTLPIAIGRKRTLIVVFTLAGILVFGILYYMYEQLYNQRIPMLYFLFTIIAPLLYFCIRTWDAKKTKEYVLLSNLLKWVMFFGICSLLLYRFVGQI